MVRRLSTSDVKESSANNRLARPTRPSWPDLIRPSRGEARPSVSRTCPGSTILFFTLLNNILQINTLFLTLTDRSGRTVESSILNRLTDFSVYPRPLFSCIQKDGTTGRSAGLATRHPLSAIPLAGIRAPRLDPGAAACYRSAASTRASGTSEGGATCRHGFGAC
jgi:hypothetical protein